MANVHNQRISRFLDEVTHRAMMDRASALEVLNTLRSELTSRIEMVQLELGQEKDENDREAARQADIVKQENDRLARRKAIDESEEKDRQDNAKKAKEKKASK